MNSISSEDLRLLLSKWKDESPFLRIVSSTSIGTFDGIGKLTELGPEVLRIEFLIEERAIWVWLIRYSEAVCAYSDPREVPIPKKENSEAKYVCCLDCCFPPGNNRVVFMEIRDNNHGEQQRA